jgi:hypothetical protein
MSQWEIPYELSFRRVTSSISQNISPVYRQDYNRSEFYEIPYHSLYNDD